MKNCPNCEEPTISYLLILVGVRPKCNICDKTIGFHWVYFSILLCILIIPLGLVGLYLSAHFSFPTVLVLWVFIMYLVIAITAYIVPLEVKKHRWSP